MKGMQLPYLGSSMGIIVPEWSTVPDMPMCSMPGRIPLSPMWLSILLLRTPPKASGFTLNHCAEKPPPPRPTLGDACLLYTSDAADE